MSETLPRWRRRLEMELGFRAEFAGLDQGAWRVLLRTRTVVSSNHDTVLALDWPHFCAGATPACGGPQGWCYTFQGNQASKLHNRHVAMVDVLARRFPELFAERVASEVNLAVESGRLPYPNLRYSGSGEVVEAYLPALQAVRDKGVLLWGFTRSLLMARQLRDIGVSVIVSCDRTSLPGFVEDANAAGFSLAYSSSGVDDFPPAGTAVVFPIHRVGRVREVVDSPSVCPKVLADFLEDFRPQATCQLICQRCHSSKLEP